MNQFSDGEMKARCGDCAYTAGSDAHGCEITRTTAELCVLSGEPFFCHQSSAQGLVPRTDPTTGEAMLCRGFLDALMARGTQDEWRAAVAGECLRILEEATDGRVPTNDAITDRIIVAGERAHIARSA